ncbi:MAG TPA: ATP-binding cassette domain-containing protein [Gammaproteobacteria bacterium]|nr:ATP-binding cassette domain-containing protein [Gammaproteobacteria bacterium]
MSFLVRFDQITLSFADQVILRDADFAIETGERVCLIGRNGAGKSTTLKLIMAELQPDSGKIEKPKGLRISVLEQKLAEESEQTVREFVALGMIDQLARIAEYRRLSALADTSRSHLALLESLEREIEAAGGWAVDTHIDALVSQLSLPAEMKMNALSGGWRRRVALARALVSVPDLLLLDEPTNHLDISTIEWLERQLARYTGAVLFVTHDRSFVQKVATRIVDIDRGSLRSWPGSYADYLQNKAKAAGEEDRRNAEFDKKLAEEEAWIRQGVKARTTRNEGRVRALEEMREEAAARIKRPRTARIHINESGDVSGRKVIEAKSVSHSFGGKPLLRDFSLRVMRGDRLGIIGNNGVGKTTLLRILLGEIEPEAGSVKLGTNLEIAYFDQLRRELDESKTVAEIVGEGRDYISLYGKKKHVVGYLTDFLFSAKRAMTPVGALSGGERNRVILAKLFTRSANLLVLDEPTNDLDVETLEALEARLEEYSGTLLVVSHDRHFLDAVVTSTLVFEDDGQIRKYAGGYSDWARLRHALTVTDDPSRRKTETASGNAAAPKKASAPAKLSYKLQRELDGLPDRIEALEAEVAALQAEIGRPEFYRQPREDVEARLALLHEQQRNLEAAVERWAELEQQAASLAARGSV